MLALLGTAAAVRGEQPLLPGRSFHSTPADVVSLVAPTGPVTIPLHTTVTVLPYLYIVSETPAAVVSGTQVAFPVGTRPAKQEAVAWLQVYHNQVLEFTLQGGGKPNKPPEDPGKKVIGTNVTLRFYTFEDPYSPFMVSGPQLLPDGLFVSFPAVSPSLSEGAMRVEMVLQRNTTPGNGPPLNTAVVLSVNAS